MTQGFGMWIGAQLMTALKKGLTTTAADGTETVAWQPFWLYPALGALVVLVLFVLLFRPRKTTAPEPAAA